MFLNVPLRWETARVGHWDRLTEVRHSEVFLLLRGLLLPEKGKLYIQFSKHLWNVFHVPGL